MRDVTQFLTIGEDPVECSVCYSNTLNRSNCTCKLAICLTCLNKWINDYGNNYCTVCLDLYFETTFEESILNTERFRDVMHILRGRLNRIREGEDEEDEPTSDEAYVSLICNLSTSMMTDGTETDEELERIKQIMKTVEHLMILGLEKIE